MNTAYQGKALATKALEFYELFKRDVASYRPRFDGRGTRTQLITTLAICASINAIIAIIFWRGDNGGAASEMPTLDFLCGLLTGIAIYMPFFAALIRRLHDTDRNAGAILVAIIPYIGIFWFIGILLWEGDEGANSFGLNPRPVKV